MLPAARGVTEWSETLNGLRVRLLAPNGTTYKQASVLPLVVEVQNNSEKPIACNTLWYTVRFLANGAGGNWLGIPRMGPDMGDWAGQTSDLAPGQTTQLRLCLQSLRFNRPLKAGETIQLQASAPTQKLRPGQLPLEVLTPALDIHVQDAFPPDVGEADFRAEWRMNLACEWYMGFKSGTRYLQVDEHGAAKLLNAYQVNGQVINNCLQVTLPPQRLKELAAALRQMQAWKLAGIPQDRPPAPDAGSIRLSLICPTGASVVGLYPSQLEGSEPVVGELRRLVEGLMDDVEKIAKAPAAKSASTDANTEPAKDIGTTVNDDRARSQTDPLALLRGVEEARSAFLRDGLNSRLTPKAAGI